MASTFTPLLKFNKPALGDTGWGTAVNGGFTDLADSAIAGTTTLSTDVDVTLTTANGAADQARQMILNCTGSRAAQRTITAPAASKVYVVINGTTGDFGVKIVGAGPTTGVVVPNGRMAVVAWNGTDFVTLGAVVDLTATGNVTVSGTTTLATLTASGNVSFDGGSFVFNESGADKDARFEGDGDPNLLFLDASADRVGIGTNAPGYKLAVSGDVAVLGQNTLRLQNSDNTNAYALQNAGATGSGNAYLAFVQSGVAERMRLDASGNLGLGVTPSAWSSAIRALDISGGSLAASSVTTQLSHNAFFDGAFKYKANGFAADYRVNQGDGSHAWYTAPSGTAGDPISFTQAMTLDGSGNLGIGTSSPNVKLHVDSGAVDEVARFEATGEPYISLYDTNVRQAYIAAGISVVGFAVEVNKPLAFSTNNTERARITDGGTFAVGTTTPASGASLDVNGSIRAKQGAPDAADSSTTGYAFGGDGDTGMFSPVVGGGAGNGVLAFYCNDQERLRMTANNRSLISTIESTAPTLSTDSTMSFELTSNTSLKVVVRGTDGVTRSVSLTLS
jgi:hypothetical protein